MRRSRDLTDGQRLSSRGWARGSAGAQREGREEKERRRKCFGNELNQREEKKEEKELFRYRTTFPSMEVVE